MSENLITDAVSKGKFSVLDVAKGRGYPQDIVDVYTDHEAAFQMHRLEQRIANERDGEKVNALDAERKALKERVKESVLTFHMRGISQGLVEDLQKKADVEFIEQDDPAKIHWLNNLYLAHHIISVTNGKNEVDDHRWTSEEIAELKNALPFESSEKLIGLMMELTFAARYFDEAVSADF